MKAQSLVTFPKLDSKLKASLLLMPHVENYWNVKQFKVLFIKSNNLVNSYLRALECNFLHLLTEIMPFLKWTTLT